MNTYSFYDSNKFYNYWKILKMIISFKFTIKYSGNRFQYCITIFFLKIIVEYEKYESSRIYTNIKFQ
jgi:hypothetical protein